MAKRFYCTKKIRVAVSIILVAFFCSLTATEVFAFETFNGHKCKRGAGLYYYVYPQTSAYTDDVITGAYRWTITNSPASLDRTYQTKPSSIDFFYRNYSSGSYRYANAWTEHVRDGYGKIDGNRENWDYSRIYLNGYNVTANTERTKVVVCHEIGHAFGLAHTNNNPRNIMCQEGYGRTAHNPSADDVAGINYLY